MDSLVQIKELIYEIRGVKVILDSDLAALYEVETKLLNRAVKRNITRFPSHFMFQLTKNEWEFLRCQYGTFKNDIRKYLPYAFTEQGVAMLSSVLHSERAIQVNIQIMDTFVKLREWAIDNKEIKQKFSNLEHYFIEHCKDDNLNQEETKQHLSKIYQAIELLTERTKPAKIGFKTN